MQRIEHRPVGELEGLDVAAFIGDTNFLEGRVLTGIQEQFSSANIDGMGDIIIENDKPLKTNDRIHVSLRPEKIGVSRSDPTPYENQNALLGTVEEVLVWVLSVSPVTLHHSCQEIQ